MESNLFILVIQDSINKPDKALDLNFYGYFLEYLTPQGIFKGLAEFHCTPWQTPLTSPRFLIPLDK